MSVTTSLTPNTSYSRCKFHMVFEPRWLISWIYTVGIGKCIIRLLYEHASLIWFYNFDLYVECSTTYTEFHFNQANYEQVYLCSDPRLSDTIVCGHKQKYSPLHAANIFTYTNAINSRFTFQTWTQWTGILAIYDLIIAYIVSMLISIRFHFHVNNASIYPTVFFESA